MKRFLLLLVITTLSVFMIAGCKKSAEESNKLVVGLNAEFPPFEYKEANGNITGFDVDLMNEIGKLINKEIEYKNMSFDSILIAIQSGKIDISISGMTATDERRQVVNFSTPYFVSKQAIITNQDTAITNFDDLTGKTIGVVLGYTGDLAVTEKYKDTAKIIKFDSGDQLILALKSRKMDLAVIDMEPAKKYVEVNTELKLIETPLAEEEYSIAIPKGKEQLVEDINKALETLKSNGTYDKIYKKYFKD